MDPTPRSSWHAHLMDVYESMKAANPGTTLKQAMTAAKDPWLASKHRVGVRKTVLASLKKGAMAPNGTRRKDYQANEATDIMKQQ
jgi:hypothetical protein